MAAYLSAALLAAAASTSSAVRLVHPFTAVSLADGTAAFRWLPPPNFAVIGATPGAFVPVAQMPRASLLYASEAFSSELGYEIMARVDAAAAAGRLAIMQSGFVLSSVDLALAAAVLASAAANPAQWSVPDRDSSDGGGGRSGGGGGGGGGDGGDGGGGGGGMGAGMPVTAGAVGAGGAFLKAINARCPRALFAWSPHELAELQDSEAAAYAAGEAAVLAAARKLVLVPLADARPDLLPPAAVTLRATEWAWGVARSRCVDPAPVGCPRKSCLQSHRHPPHFMTSFIDRCNGIL